MNVKIDPSWANYLQDEFEKPYFNELTAFVKKEYQDEIVYPPPKYIFRAFDLCPFKKVKVVILGQDPYHGQRQANGLAFAVDEREAVPPSLQNIFKEIESDIGNRAESDEVLRSANRSGDLTRWAEQGVLLLNATLTVRAHMAGSHQGRGWESFTDAAIRALSEERGNLVFMLWGNYAKEKGAHIDKSKHLVLEAPHPSPFSAASGFFGCKHFSKANEYLLEHGETPIDWS
ncbi:uracil-DNA glycosylase [Candidatus Kaiserbacteria bacterium CG_4_9_14_3_um_filter_50_16]|uniref:Uracil-DNA glycosylase n=1 Tax=Candidatus Kaiserbacteria bacterium CG08_land_8_20_14_0_20_50_21 TaxID=1974604 RepID=A0A2H0YXR8_9BACT|nr:MAG: uracil-DNA glycosylase [Parcubacteria group bacterium CG1_02_50_68]PIS43277.1 MAG: uracil-DNA glycosylase [Candidatus Kaiserbacteria bacterium CG08_land_8_20_14_0_20_50_21]PIU81821.1 MAG: uracil-DNA glycosylase [Candidatus Kaiserbacteria bacterium CG06_land_8_20_14_3_00_49_31]PIW96471.1 MAG: uracil-DNA glycosylase [Candidatus Kaiserbacteria bacterium CG_4_8_14_3_um_filter_50_23]PJA00899.1 MAG: uracil-DNA glycosylase [Candidatus Kaiserbacteria bacterium CG_4_10_14_0_2_um_filter_50_16]PJ